MKKTTSTKSTKTTTTTISSIVSNIFKNSKNPSKLTASDVYLSVLRTKGMSVKNTTVRDFFTNYKNHPSYRSVEKSYYETMKRFQNTPPTTPTTPAKKTGLFGIKTGRKMSNKA